MAAPKVQQARVPAPMLEATGGSSGSLFAPFARRKGRHKTGSRKLVTATALVGGFCDSLNEPGQILRVLWRFLQ